MRKILDVNAFKKLVSTTGDKRALIKFIKDSGIVYLNANAILLLKLKIGDKLAFSEDLQAIKNHNSLEAALLKEGKNCMSFNNKAFVNHVFETFKITDEYSNIRFQIGTQADGDGWYELITSSIEKKLKDAK